MKEKLNSKGMSTIPYFSSFAGGIISFIGFLALLGWITNHRILASFSVNYIPMAPDTSLIFIFLGLLFVFKLHSLSQQWSKIVIVVFLCVISIYGFLKFLEFFLNVDLTFESILFPISERLGSYPLKKMSPITGLLFSVGTTSLMVKMLGKYNKKTVNVISGLGMVIVMVSFVAILGYIFGTADLYGEKIIPLALTTSISFFAFGGSLILIAGPESAFLRHVVGDSVNAQLIRAILPIGILAILFQGVSGIIIPKIYNINHAIFLALLTFFFISITTFSVLRISSKIFNKTKRLEIENKLSTEKLNHNNDLLRLTGSMAQVGGWEFDPVNLKGTWTEEVARIHDLDPQQETDVSLGLSFYHGVSLIKIEKAIDDAINHGIPYDLELELISSIGVHKWVHTIGIPEIVDGKVIKVKGIFQDISAFKESQLSLEKSREYIDYLIQTSNAMLVVLDKNGNLIQINPAAEKITGYSKDELFGKNWFELIAPKERYPQVWNEFERLRERGVPKNFENPILTKTGEERFIVWQNSEVFVEGEVENIISFGIDITDRKNAEEKLEILNNELEQRVLERTSQLELAIKNLDSFSYSVSHDLRAPIRAIDGYSNLLITDYSDKLEDEGRRYLEKIHSSIMRMNQLIDDLFNLSHASRIEIELESINLSEMAEKIFEEQKNQYPNKKVEFIVSKDLSYVTDPRLTNILLSNLISNALKYSIKNETVTITFDKTIIEGDCVFFVKDNGTGFDMKYIDKIFLPFSRLHNSDEYPGTGIGLAIVQRVINRLGGQIWAESKPNEGATFFFTLGKPNN